MEINRIIARRPRLLDAVLDPGFFGAVPTPEKLKELVRGAIAEARDHQDALDRARSIGRAQIGTRNWAHPVSVAPGSIGACWPSEAPLW